MDGESADDLLDRSDGVPDHRRMWDDRQLPYSPSHGVGGRRDQPQCASRFGHRLFAVAQSQHRADVHWGARGWHRDDGDDRVDTQENPRKTGFGDRDHFLDAVRHRRDPDQLGTNGRGSSRCRVRAIRRDRVRAAGPSEDRAGAGRIVGGEKHPGAQLGDVSRWQDADNRAAAGHPHGGGHRRHAAVDFGVLQGTAGDEFRLRLVVVAGHQLDRGALRADGDALGDHRQRVRGGRRDPRHCNADPARGDRVAAVVSVAADVWHHRRSRLAERGGRHPLGHMAELLARRGDGGRRLGAIRAGVDVQPKPRVATALAWP